MRVLSMRFIHLMVFLKSPLRSLTLKPLSLPSKLFSAVNTLTVTMRPGDCSEIEVEAETSVQNMKEKDSSLELHGGSKNLD